MWHLKGSGGETVRAGAEAEGQGQNDRAGGSQQAKGEVPGYAVGQAEGKGARVWGHTGETQGPTLRAPNPEGRGGIGGLGPAIRTPNLGRQRSRGLQEPSGFWRGRHSPRERVKSSPGRGVGLNLSEWPESGSRQAYLLTVTTACCECLPGPRHTWLVKSLCAHTRKEAVCTGARVSQGRRGQDW